MLKGYRTFIVNILLGLVPLIEVFGQILNIPEMRGVVPAQYLPWYGVVVALVNLYLRSITTTPPGQK